MKAYDYQYFTTACDNQSDINNTLNDYQHFNTSCDNQSDINNTCTLNGFQYFNNALVTINPILTTH